MAKPRNHGVKRPRCPLCRNPLPKWDRRKYGNCAACRRMRAHIRYSTSGPAPAQPGRAERVERYAALVAEGKRIFE